MLIRHNITGGRWNEKRLVQRFNTVMKASNRLQPQEAIIGAELQKRFNKTQADKPFDVFFCLFLTRFDPYDG